MRITKRKEDELISHLQKSSISIAELQLEMNVSYIDACGLIEYALGHKWISKCKKGNLFPVITSDFSRKDLPADICKKIYNVLDYDELDVLYYLGSRFNATLLDIMKNVDDDRSDMQNALNNLIDTGLILKYGDHYHCKISKKTIRLIKKHGDLQTDCNHLGIMHSLFNAH